MPSAWQSRIGNRIRFGGTCPLTCPDCGPMIHLSGLLVWIGRTFYQIEWVFKRVCFNWPERDFHWSRV